MASQLEARPEIAVVCQLDHDKALAWPIESWSSVDVAIIDVLDEFAPAEVGTDLYSGIMTLQRIRHLAVRTVAILPHPGNALMALRIHESGADGVYHRWELNDLDQLVRAIVHPDAARSPKRPDEVELRAFGARLSAKVNEAVEHYETSLLYGQLAPDIGQKSLAVPRRVLDRFRRQIASTGFDGTETRSLAGRRALAPRWPDVRDYLLRILGRKDVRHTEHD